MRKIFFVALIFNSFTAVAQLMGGTMYVAAKTGLSIRDKAETGATVIEKIPYGTKITVLEYGEEKKSITTEGMLGYWQKVKYNNKTGYIIDSYLFPWPPPRLAIVKDLAGYLKQVTVPFGSKLVVKSGSMNNIEESGYELQKQLYKNGAEWQKFLGYEYGSDTYFLPGFDLETGFLLLRLLPEFKDVFSGNDVFPTENKKFKKGEIEYEIKIDQEIFDGGYSYKKKIRVEYADGASYYLELYMLDSQLVIFFGSGV